MVFAIASLSDRFAAETFEVNGRGADEDQAQSCERIATLPEQRFFDQTLPQPLPLRCLSRLLVSRQWFAQPSHRAIEMA